MYALWKDSLGIYCKGKQSVYSMLYIGLSYLLTKSLK